MNKIINVLENGLVSSKTVNQTNELQKIINSLEENSVLFFPKGYYLLSSIILRSHLTIEIDSDATIIGDKFDTFLPSEHKDFTLYQDQSHSYFQPSLFFGNHVEGVKFIGKGTIDMDSQWDEKNVRDIVHRGAKCITFSESKDILVDGLKILNATDLALYFISSENILCQNIKMRVYIDGISPDNCKNVEIRNCDIEAGDDCIVLKSTFNLNRFDYCKNIFAHDCVLKSRCNCVKIGTETNGGFYDVSFKNLKMSDTRITGISLETVDGAKIENFTFENIDMVNVATPIFVFVGKRMRAPKGTDIGYIKNVRFCNMSAKGPYQTCEIIPCYYVLYKANSHRQFPGHYSGEEYRESGTWQTCSIISGLKESPIENISFEKMHFILDGGRKEAVEQFTMRGDEYPEVSNFGDITPALGFYFNYVNGLSINDIVIETYNDDCRKHIIYENTTNINVK